MKYFTLILCFIITSCAQANEDCGFIKNNYGENLSWKKTPIDFYIDTSIPSEYHDAIYFSAKKWNQAVGKQLINIKGTTTIEKFDVKDRVNSISFPKKWPRSKREQGTTSVYWNGNTIVETDIIINSVNFKFFTGNMGYTGKISFESLMIHEMGHSLGLKHIDDKTNVMNYFLETDEERMTITEETINFLQCEYK